MVLTASYMAACITAKLRVGWTVAGCAPGVRTIVRSVLFHCITGLSCAAADSAQAERQMLRDRIAHALASDVESRDMFIPPVVKRNFGASMHGSALRRSRLTGRGKYSIHHQLKSAIAPRHVTPVSSHAAVLI